MWHKIKIIVVLIGFLLPSAVNAQYAQNLPYSNYGIGYLSGNGTAHISGMGGTSMGMRLPNHINYSNPASYTSQDTMSFIFEGGVFGDFKNYSNGINASSYDGNIDHITIGFPITSWLKSSVGITPYSQVDYKFSVPYEKADKYYLGEGGLNKFYIGNSIELFNQLSLGFNFSYIFGSINKNLNILYSGSADTTHMDLYNVSRYAFEGFNFDLGLQYYANLSKNLNITIGGVYSTKIPLNTEKQTSTYTSYDTLVHKTANISNVTIPTKIGGGIALNIKDKYLISADYIHQDWNDFIFENPKNNVQLQSYQTYRLGFQYVQDKSDVRNYLNRIRYRIGAHYSNTHLQLYNKPLIDKGFSLGLGFPFGNNSFNIAFKYGSRGNSNATSIIKETYKRITFSVTFYDFWFFERKYD